MAHNHRFEIFDCHHKLLLQFKNTHPIEMFDAEGKVATSGKRIIREKRESLFLMRKTPKSQKLKSRTWMKLDGNLKF